MSDTDKQTLIDLYEILIIKNLKATHTTLQKTKIKILKEVILVKDIDSYSFKKRLLNFQVILKCK